MQLSDEILLENLLATHDFRFVLRFCAPGGCARHAFFSLEQLHPNVNSNFCRRHSRFKYRLQMICPVSVSHFTLAVAHGTQAFGARMPIASLGGVACCIGRYGIIALPVSFHVPRNGRGITPVHSNWKIAVGKPVLPVANRRLERSLGSQLFSCLLNVFCTRRRVVGDN